MATPELVAFFAPEFETSDFSVIVQALAMAEDFRPGCLSQSLGDQAVALYAAWLLSLRVRSSTSSTGADIGPVGPLIMEKEGDLTRQYALPSAGATTTTAGTDGDYKARYDVLAARCRRGAIFVRQTYPNWCP